MNRFVSILASVFAVALAGVAVHDQVAFAQPAAAIGHPLPDGNLPAGTISVRIIAGPGVAVPGADVTLTVNNEPRSARTDAAGRATFAGLPVGATVQAQVADADGKPISSDAFPVPEEGGARVMLSTKPLQGAGGMVQPEAGEGAGGGGGPMSGAGMPEARAMSGQPRPERTDLPGTYTVRVTYNDLKLVAGKMTDPNPPVDVPVSLVAYGADDSISVVTKKAAADGHVTFDSLDQTGGTAYFALALLPRGSGTDRLIAVPAVLDSQTGVRCVLSGDKRDATSPPIDDYNKLVPQDTAATPAGKVRVSLDGVPVDGSAKVTLYDAATMKPLGVQSPHEGAPDPSQVRAQADYNPVKDLPAGTFEVEVKGGPGTATNPTPGVSVQLVAADTEQPIADTSAITGMDGKARITTKVTSSVKAVLVINGKTMGSAPIDLSVTGGKLDVTANWSTRGKPEAVFDVVARPELVLFAETVMNKQLFRSLPFQVSPETGTHASIYVYPRTLFTFSVHSFIEDQLLAVQGSFEVTNYSWAPYRASPDGLLIKLPAHHKGGIIAAQDQGDVSVAQGEGFRLMRPIPPGGRKFRAGFSLPVDNGEVNWAFDLPMGTWQSNMEIRQSEGMKVTLPPGTTGETRTASTGEPWFVVDNFTIERGQSLVMKISGLPAEAQWKIWAPRIVALFVLGLLLGGIAFAMLRQAPAPKPDHEARRAKLLDELVDLDREGKQDTRRRAQILDELERLWGA